MQNMVYVYIILYIVNGFFVCTTTEKYCHKANRLNCGFCGICIRNFNESKNYCRGDAHDQMYESNWPECSLKNYCKINNPCSKPEQCVTTMSTYFCMCPEEYHGRQCQFKSGKFVT